MIEKMLQTVANLPLRFGGHRDISAAAPGAPQATAIRLALPPAAVVLIEVETSSSSQSSM